MNSIISDVKTLLGISTDDEYFDQNIIIFINSAFSKLSQIGVGSTKPFKIITGNETWTDFMQDDLLLESIKEYVFAKVKIAFDPPINKTSMDALQSIINEDEWRLSVAYKQSEGGD